MVEVRFMKEKTEKQFKTNAYETNVEEKGTTHLKQAPKPHGYGGRVTEDSE